MLVAALAAGSAGHPMFQGGLELFKACTPPVRNVPTALSILPSDLVHLLHCCQGYVDAFSAQPQELLHTA
jgi:hypothetical protein